MCKKEKKSYTNKITIKNFSSPLFFQVFSFSTIYIILISLWISYIFLQCTVCLQYKDPFNKEITISLSSSWNSLTFSVSEDRRGQQHFFGALTSFRTPSFFCPTHTHTHTFCLYDRRLVVDEGWKNIHIVSWWFASFPGFHGVRGHVGGTGWSASLVFLRKNRPDATNGSSTKEKTAFVTL